MTGASPHTLNHGNFINPLALKNGPAKIGEETHSCVTGEYQRDIDTAALKSDLEPVAGPFDQGRILNEELGHSVHVPPSRVSCCRTVEHAGVTEGVLSPAHLQALEVVAQIEWSNAFAFCQGLLECHKQTDRGVSAEHPAIAEVACFDLEFHAVSEPPADRWSVDEEYSVDIRHFSSQCVVWKPQASKSTEEGESVINLPELWLKSDNRINSGFFVQATTHSGESVIESGRQHCPVSRCERTGSGLLKYRNTASLRLGVNRVAAREGAPTRPPVYCAETRQARISRRSRQHLLPTRRVKVGLHRKAFTSKRVHERVLGQDAVARLQPLHSVQKFGLTPRADGFRHFIAPVDFARAKPAPGAGGCQLEKNGRF